MSAQHHRDEHVRRHAERDARLAHAAQVHDHEHEHRGDADGITVCGISAGYADVIAATPPEIDTATVRM